MIRQLILITALAGAWSAQAETVSCTGTGKYSGVGGQPIELVWGTKSQATLIENSNLKVMVDLDKSNSDDSHYLEITVLKTSGKKNVVVTGNSAKGSVKDVVQFSEVSANQTASVIGCMIVK